MSDFSNPTLYYQHSGKFPPLAPLLVLAIGTLGAAVLSIAYGYAVHYIPWVLVNIILPFAFSILLGVIMTIAGKAAKMRNSSILALIALFVVLAGRYLTLIVWIFAATEQQTLVYTPGDIFAILQFASHEGLWDIGGWTPKKLLWVIWSAETLVMVAIPTFVCYGQNDPFCELCKKWVKGCLAFTPLECVDDIQQLQGQLEARDISGLLALKPCDEDCTTFSTITLSYCTDCRSNCYLSVEKVHKYKDKKNREQTEVTGIVQNMIISKETFIQIRDHLEEATGSIDISDV